MYKRLPRSTITRLEKMLDNMRYKEMGLNLKYGEPEPGSEREENIKNAKAIGDVLLYLHKLYLSEI